MIDMQSVDLLLTNITQLVTCASDGVPKRGLAMRDVGILSNVAVAMDGGRIVAIGPSVEVEREYTSDNVIECRDTAVIPGFVDCHTHTVFAGDRLNEFEMRIQGATYMDIMTAGGGILKTMRATRAASEEQLLSDMLERLREMTVLGTTTVEIKTGYGLDIESEVRLIEAIKLLDGVRGHSIVPTFLGAHAVPPEFPDAESYTRYVIEEMLPAVHERFAKRLIAKGKLVFIDVFCEKGAFDVVQSRRILEAGKALGMGIKAHVDEFVNLGGVPMAVELGAFSVDHLDVTPEHELELLANSNTVGVMLPAVNFNLGSFHYGNARHLIDSGGILALATDFNPGSAPTISMPMVMAIACRYQKLLPSEALNACTINAAHAIGSSDKVGSIEVGKKADLLILKSHDYRAAAYEFGANPVDMTIINGEVRTTRYEQLG